MLHFECFDLRAKPKLYPCGMTVVAFVPNRCAL